MSITSKPMYDLTGAKAESRRRLQDIVDSESHSAEARILAFLQLGNTLTALEALNRFGCFRLAVYIDRLRKKNVAIETDMVTENGKTFAKYFINSIKK